MFSYRFYYFTKQNRGLINPWHFREKNQIMNVIKRECANTIILRVLQYIYILRESGCLSMDYNELHMLIESGCVLMSLALFHTFLLLQQLMGISPGNKRWKVAGQDSHHFPWSFLVLSAVNQKNCATESLFLDTLKIYYIQIIVNIQRQLFYSFFI